MRCKRERFTTDSNLEFEQLADLAAREKQDDIQQFKRHIRSVRSNGEISAKPTRKQTNKK